MRDSERDRIFDEWLASHKGILFKVVHAYAFEHADRQDLFQEIVVQVWRSVDAFRGESSVPTWMYRVALNTAITWARKEGRHQRGKQPLEVVEGLLTTSPAAPDPRVEWLYRQIAQLKDVDRSVALLLLDGFSYKEIAAVVGITESNVGVKIYPYDDDVLTGWDYAIPIVGMATALLWGRAMYVSHRAQALREQSFGESLRDQLGRHIAQLDYQVTRLRLGNVLVTALLPVVGSTTMILGTLRINEKRPSDEWVLIVGMIFVGVTAVAASFWEERRRVQRDLLPRKRRLEALLKELDAP